MKLQIQSDCEPPRGASGSSIALVQLQGQQEGGGSVSGGELWINFEWILQSGRELTVGGDVDLVGQLADVHLEAVLDVVERAGVAFVGHERDSQTFRAKPARPGNLQQHTLVTLPADYSRALYICLIVNNSHVQWLFFLFLSKKLYHSSHI